MSDDPISDLTEVTEIPDYGTEVDEHRGLLSQYLKDISIYPRLTIEEEHKLSKIIMTSKSTKEVRKARDKLIVSNLRLVVKWAVGYSKRLHPNSSLTIMDLITSGNMALSRASEQFDCSKSKFGTWASTIIKQRICATMQRDGDLIRKPRAHWEILSEVNSLKASHEDITDKEIQEKLGISDRKMERAQIGVYINRETEFDMMIERGEIKLEEDPSHFPIPEQLSRKELLDVIIDKLKQLKPQAKDIFLRRSMADETLESIAQSYGITREAVRIKYLSAARKLKAILRLHFDYALAQTIPCTEQEKLANRLSVRKRKTELQRQRKLQGQTLQVEIKQPYDYRKSRDKEYVKAYQKAYRDKKRKEKENDNGKSGGTAAGEGNGSNRESNRRNYHTRKSAGFVQRLLKDSEGGEREAKPKPSEFDKIAKEIHEAL